MCSSDLLITFEEYTLDCEILQKVGEDEKEGQHQVIGNIHTHNFQEVYAQKQEDYLHSEGKDKSFHSHIQPALGLDVSLHGGIPPGRSLDWRMIKEFSQNVAPLIDLGGVGALGGHGTTLRVLGKLKEEWDILPTSSLPTLTSDIALR